MPLLTPASAPITSGEVVQFTDQRCIADPLVAGESTSGMLAFPWIAWDRNGLLLMSYHDGYDGSIGVTRLKTSVDKGVTWTPGVVVWDEGLGTGAQIAALSSGDWLLTSQGYVSGSPSGVYTKRSMDRGTSWGATQHVMAGEWTSSGIIELASGTLLWPVYSSSTAQILRSTDGGYTWSTPVVALALPGGVSANETTVRHLPDGSVVALTRCSDFSLRRIVSTDEGVTWSAPTTVTSGVDSRVDWVVLASGRCVATWRDSSSACEMAAYSDDYMTTVSTPVQIHGPDKRTSYSALWEVAPGQVLAAIGEIDDGESTGRIMCRYLLDGDGAAPTGQVTYVDARTRAAGASTLLAWDTFNRPDNAHGLGSADSGQQWLEQGGNTQDDWRLSGGMAVNSGSTGRIHSVTLNTGNADGWVEADLLWTGSTSSPIGLCARRSTVNGHAVGAKLDSNGGTLRIFYFDGSVPNDLITSVAGLHFTAGVWMTWRLVVRGSYVRVFIDGHEYASYVLTSTDIANLSNGGTRWGLWGGGSSGVVYKARRFVISS